MIYRYDNFIPKVPASAFVHKNSEVIGKVRLGEYVSVWPYAVLRGDVEDIVVGDRSNVQDNSVIHTNVGFPSIIGSKVTVGHNANIHGCSIGNACLIGIGAIVLDGAEIGDEVLIGAGSVVAPGMKIPSRSLVMGVPARIIRTLKQEEIDGIYRNAEEYLRYTDRFRKTAKEMV